MYVRILEIVPPKAEAQPAKSVNVKMPKLIAMAVPRIRLQKADPAMLPAPGARPLPTFGAPKGGGFLGGGQGRG